MPFAVCTPAHGCKASNSRLSACLQNAAWWDSSQTQHISAFLQSTLFNAICKNAKAQAANFPFCTIEPNVGIVAVPDDRLQVRLTWPYMHGILPSFFPALLCVCCACSLSTRLGTFFGNAKCTDCTISGTERPLQIQEASANQHRVRGHCGPCEGCQHWRGSGQQVLGKHPGM